MKLYVTFVAPGIWRCFLIFGKNCGPLLYCIYFRRVRVVAKKSLLPSLYQSVPPYVPARLPLDGYPWNLILGDFHENSSRNSKSGYNWTNISGTLQVQLTTFNCCRRHNFTLKASFSTQSIFMFLEVTCSSTIRKEDIVAFPWQWLRGIVTILRYTYTAFLVYYLYVIHSL